ncbi:hypothetical protein LAZ67_5000616 [Cordylochernes scorpioides]|uniref:Reverse transcriptase domain-containing protein n=1 Tax=Cordylochernes scorpioides TaxID=51811 RepID=A0ABY6KGX3_9ARAC|nr:hypothetical protein LAZ67_5000616 [Cordylochernes scorpioides]
MENYISDWVHHVRQRLFQALFYKVAMTYSKVCPKPVRTCLEMAVLAKAVLSLLVLSYIHVRFIRTPTTCLSGVDWPRDGILRVQVLRNPGEEVVLDSNITQDPTSSLLLPVDLFKDQESTVLLASTPAISLYFNGKRIVIANIYIHPNSMAAFHIQFISEILEAFGQLPIILCGDFNSRHPLWFDSTTNKNGYILKSIIEEQNLFVHNLKIPTCRNASIIDLTISNKHSIGLIHNWRTSALSVTSDHLAILFDIFNMINLANNNRQTSTWKFREKSANWTKFAESISPSDLLDLNSASKHIVNCEDIDNVVIKLTNLVIEAAYSSLDVKHHTSINTTTSKNWWNKELQQLKEHLHYLRNLYYRGGNLNPSIYRAARNKYLRAINRAKKTSWKIFIEENESTNAFGNAYRIFKRLRSADIQVGIPLLNKTAECMREQKMKEMLTAFFPDDDVRLDNEEHTLIRNHIPSFTNREIIFITEKEIKDLCSNLNIRKAPGPDNVSNFMIKHSLLSILPSLVKLFNECLVLGYYPESWKHSVLKIIAKPQKADYEAINSYRPISLTSNFSKIFETIIKNKILNYYNHNNLLSHRQHGFTKRKSTITALDKITETILKHKQNELVALIAIDISGAFDNAWWPALIKRMDEDHVPAVLIKIIQSFLNRRRKTSLTFSNTTISKYLSKGCPQGGPLSPLLWNIVLNDLLINFASPNSEIICYADDVSIVCWHKTIEGLKNETERTLNYVIQWCTRNKLKLSPEKTGLIHMHGKQNIPMGTQNFIIKPVEEVKILGIKFSNHRIKSKINFTPHINDILCKINRMKNLLFSLCGKMWGLDAKKILILYKTLFRPILTYGSEIWYKFINKRSKQRLNSQQYQILLWVVRAYKTTSSNCIHSLAKIPILTDQIESLIIKYDLANLSKEEINVFRPHAPTIIHNYIESRMAETIANTNETFRKFFPFGVPFYFRPNFYNSQFVTGHGNFGEFLSKIGATDDPSCFCGKENQDSMHLLMECPMFHSYRNKAQDEYIVEYSLEYGLLRLTPTARERLKIPIKTVTLAWINASKTNLSKIDRIQASAAKIISGLRGSCPNGIAELKSILLPLHLRRKICFSKFITKKINSPKEHLTGKFIRNWVPNQRLKRPTPLNLAHNSNLLDIPINPKHRTSYPPHKTRNKLICFPHLPDNPHKHETQPELLKALGLQIIEENSSLFNITIYTDGSQLETGLSGSGIAIYKDKILHLSVYKSELSAIDTALKDININSPSKIIIYSDSRAAIYTLQSCFSSQEPLLKSMAKSWLPAHVGIPGNELADSLAKAGALGLPEARESTTQLDERDLLRTIKTQCLHEWESDAAPDWYRAGGTSTSSVLPREQQSLISRLKSGHLRTLTFQNGCRVFPLCTKCNSQPATPRHIIDY